MAAAESEEPAGAPDWIVTFADMISLLVTFFILLMTFSTMEVYDAFNTDGALVGSQGILRNDTGDTIQEPPDVDIMMAMDAMRGARTPHSRPAAELLDDLSEAAATKDDEHHEIDLNIVADGIVLAWDERAAFAPGSTELAPYLKLALREAATILEHYPHQVVVEGHADSQAPSSAAHPDAHALSLGRAEAAASYLLETSSLDPMQVQLAAHGDTRPRETNETPEGRQLNRRVELRILSLSEYRASQLDEEER